MIPKNESSTIVRVRKQTTLSGNNSLLLSFSLPLLITSQMATIFRLSSPLFRNTVVQFGVNRRFVHVEAKIASLGLKLPAISTPKGNFVNFVQVGNLVFVSGHLPQPADGNLVIGTVGKEVSIEQGNNRIYFILSNINSNGYCLSSNHLYRI